MEQRLVISNILQFSGFVNRYPQILNIPSFNVIKQAFVAPPSKKGCNCKNKSAIVKFRPQFEAALAVLSDTEKNQLKAILGTSDICYYKKIPNGQLKLTCF